MKRSDRPTGVLVGLAVATLVGLLAFSLFGLAAPRFAPVEPQSLSRSATGTSALSSPAKVGSAAKPAAQLVEPARPIAIAQLWPAWVGATVLCCLFAISLWCRHGSLAAAIIMTLGLALTTSVFQLTRVPPIIALECCLLYAAFFFATQVRSTHFLSLSCEALLIAGLTSLSLRFLPVALFLAVWGIERNRLSPWWRRLGHGTALVILLGSAGWIAWHKGFAVVPLRVWIEGVDGLALSTGKGIFWYNPILLLCLLLPTSQRFAGALLALTALLATALGQNWFLPAGWGPVAVFCLVPILYQLVCEQIVPSWTAWSGVKKISVACLFAFGLGIQIVGASFSPTAYLEVLRAVRVRSGAPGWFQERATDSHFIPQFSPLRGQWWLLRHKLRSDPDLGKDAPFLFLLPEPLRLSDLSSRIELDWRMVSEPQKNRGALALLLSSAFMAAAGLFGVGILQKKLKA